MDSGFSRQHRILLSIQDDNGYVTIEEINKLLASGFNCEAIVRCADMGEWQGPLNAAPSIHWALMRAGIPMRARIQIHPEEWVWVRTMRDNARSNNMQQENRRGNHS